MKQFVGVSITALALILAGARSMHRQSYPPTIAKMEITAPMIDKRLTLDSPKIWACNTTLYENETLTLLFNPPNAPYLGVIDPNGHFFYIVFPTESAIENLTPFVGSTCFENLQTLELNTESLHADPYTYGVYENQRVFTKTGAYTFIMGENLHVDSPTLLNKVVITYILKPRLNQRPETTIVIK